MIRRPPSGPGLPPRTRLPNGDTSFAQFANTRCERSEPRRTHCRTTTVDTRLLQIAFDAAPALAAVGAAVAALLAVQHQVEWALAIAALRRARRNSAAEKRTPGLQTRRAALHGQ